MASGFGERLPERYCPYVGHLKDWVVLCFDGSYMAVLELQGQPWELATHAEREGRAAVFDDLMRHIAAPNLVVHAHLVRHPVVLDEPALDHPPGFPADYARAYRETLLRGRVFRNRWFLTLVLRPEAGGLRGLRRMRQERAEPAIPLSEGMERALDDAAMTVERTLHAHRPRRLGHRDVPCEDDPAYENRYSEIAEALHLMRTAHPLPVAESEGALGGEVYPHQVRMPMNRLAIDLQIPDLPRLVSSIAMRHYPTRTRPGMFNALLAAPYPLVLAQSFAFRDRIAAHAAMARKRTQMQNAGEQDEESERAIKQAMGAVTGNAAVTGWHNFALLVFGEDLAALHRNISHARNAACEFGGANLIRQRLGLEAQYWGVMPAGTEFKMRKGKVTTVDFAHFCSFEDYPRGRARGHWGPATRQFMTNGQTLYDFVTHVDELGHIAFTGYSGTGKTTAAGDLAASCAPVMGPGGLRIMLDKDQSNRLTVEMSGGRYSVFRRGRSSGVAPLFWPDTPGNRQALQRILKGLIERDRRGVISREEEAGLARGLARQFKIEDPTKRSFWGIREFLGYSDPNGAGARFEKYCAGVGEMGWLLDNDEHLVNLDTDAVPSGFFGFDFTELLPKAEDLSDDDGATGALAAVLIHELRQLMDGRRILFVGEEARFYMDPLGDILEDTALTGRKMELALWLLFQHPDHILSHPRGPSILGQIPTKISWHDPKANVDGYVRGLGYSPAALRQIKVTMGRQGGRRMLIWRDGEPVVVEHDLSGLQDHLAVLSGRPRTIKTFEQVKRDLGPDASPAEHHREFARRVRLAREAAEA